MHSLLDADEVAYMIEWLIDEPNLLELNLTMPTISGSRDGEPAHQQPSVLDAAGKVVRTHPHRSKPRLFLAVVQKIVKWQQQQRAQPSLGSSPAASTGTAAAHSAPRVQPTTAAASTSDEPTPMKIDGDDSTSASIYSRESSSALGDGGDPMSIAPSAGPPYAAGLLIESAPIEVDSDDTAPSSIVSHAACSICCSCKCAVCAECCE
jgi:hypothetical protein